MEWCRWVVRLLVMNELIYVALLVASHWPVEEETWEEDKRRRASAASRPSSPTLHCVRSTGYERVTSDSRCTASYPRLEPRPLAFQRAQSTSSHLPTLRPHAHTSSSSSAVPRQTHVTRHVHQPHQLPQPVEQDCDAQTQGRQGAPHLLVRGSGYPSLVVSPLVYAWYESV